jgi:hypothetical protein
MVIIETGQGIGGAAASSLEIVMVDPKGAKAATDGTKVTTKNVIRVSMEDHSGKDREEAKRELEEEMVEQRRKKLACFQKTRSGIVKKGDTTKAPTPVNSPFTLEELVHMIDVSINSKYVADLEGITCTLTNSVRGSVESLKLEFKQELERMSCQVRAMVQQVLDEARDKREVGSSSAGNVIHSLDAMATQGALMGAGAQKTQMVNPNLQQPYYQIQAYGPNSQVFPNAYFTRPPVMPTVTGGGGGAYLGMSDNIRDQVTRTLREFGLDTKGRVRAYQKPYPEFFDNMPYPRGF